MKRLDSVTPSGGAAARGTSASGLNTNEVIKEFKYTFKLFRNLFLLELRDSVEILIF